MTERLMTLGEAAKSLHGSMTASTLRTEAARGRLRVVKIGGKLYTRATDLVAMVNSCRVEPKAPDCILEAERAAIASGSSSTGAMSTAQAAARATVQELKERLGGTSKRSTSRSRAPAA